MNTNPSQYPEIKFWDTECEQMGFINKSEFRQAELLRMLGVQEHPLSKSFGVKSRDEIIRRQEAMRLLLASTKLAGIVKAVDINRDLPIPLEGQAFIDDYKTGKTNRFWEIADEFCNVVDENAGMCREMDMLSQYLRRMRSELKDKEMEMAQSIAKEIVKSSQLIGNLQFLAKPRSSAYTDVAYLSGQVSGHRLYSFNLSEKWKQQWNGKSHPGPAWFWSMVESGFNTFRKKVLFSPLVISAVPDEVRRDVERYLRENLDTVASVFNSEDKKVPQNWELHLEIAFKYNDQGLYVTVIGTDVSLEKDAARWQTYEFSESDVEYLGYSAREQEAAYSRARAIEDRARRVARDMFALKIFDALKNEHPELMSGEGVIISSPMCDRSFKWYAVEYLLTNKYAHLYEKLRDMREKFGKSILALRRIASLADLISHKAKEWGLPLHFPEILSEESHLVAFDKLYPIHLIEYPISEIEDGEGSGSVRRKKIVSIGSLPALNGQMVCITGQNAGGKTVTLETVIQAIYMAQSGLPVFGNGVQLNVKDYLGIMHMERGHGSTVDLMLEKIKNMMEAVNRVNGNKIALFLDEVGSATDVEGGFEISRGLLENLKDKGCSVMFVTQIQQLAEHAQDKLGAACCQFDLKHAVRGGIGKGNARNLLKRHGLSYLVN